MRTAQQTHTPPPAAQPAPKRVYISMDGVLALIHEAGYKELKIGCIYTTRTRVCQQRPDQVLIHAEQQSYLAVLTDAVRFGWQLWAEAARRGVNAATDLVVIGDGAHWIWNLADEHFPHATQILDWYHASEYVWRAAAAIYGETSELRIPWARQQLDAL